MFNRLMESDRKRQRRLGGAVASTMLHTLLIALAVRATQLTATPAPTQPIPEVIYGFDPKPPAPPEPRPADGNRSGSVDAPTPPPVAPAPLIELGFDAVGIPTVDVTRSITGPADFPDTLIAERRGGYNGPPNGERGPLEERYVDKPIVALPGTVTPRYPTTLQSAGLEGDVRAQFVVDTLGRVERGSVRVLDASHDLFASSVRDALTRARFKPAEAGGHLVRQLAEQTFTFRITK